ncbi:MAG: LytR/AlgR family response regulator transcription factor, partial [Clostridiales bacterium]
MRIAVIDDEKYSRVALVRQIEGFLPHAEIFEAGSGAQAVELLEKHTFDILFLDIHLGDMEGTTIAALARRLMPQAKIIFATAYSDYAVRAFELRADDYLLKPFDPDRIREALRRCTAEPAPAASAAPPVLHRIAVNNNRSTTLLDTDEITYIETDGIGRGCILHTISGKSYPDTTSLGEYESRLGEQD